MRCERRERARESASCIDLVRDLLFPFASDGQDNFYSSPRLLLSSLTRSLTHSSTHSLSFICLK